MVEIIPNWHPILVHFTIGLLTAGTVFYLLALAVPLWREQWLTVARWNLWSGTALTLLTALLGWRAFNTVLHDEAAHAVMLEHRDLALMTLAIFFIGAAWLLVRYRRNAGASPWLAAVLVVGVGLLATTAWHGAELVYRHGLGVMSLPHSEGPGTHAHGHGQKPAHLH
jgi:uncharacterized membrane protein